ncbi:hypothetical protein CR203_02025 [Salipaludibacillus neizhouensis]|uniref:SHSP domain-containing protein n=1 Tax=Salipaludibacillus neizhouensis TaxID=885475 RepID=A0A3A9KE63_9BACI|nr:Hsp20/alpha crystallin family protein [Salipaludibacillus neizhouensis]RKL68842.1 hypothetical protein CR203_02025 [Salipaludibacillus neizhouensis]
MSKDKKDFNKPIQEQAFGDILNSMDSFFNQAINHFQTSRPIAVHQYETADNFIIEAELPGIKKEQVQLDIFQNNIKISIHDEEARERRDKTNNISQQAFRYQRSDRIISLPFAINETDLKANLSQGLLTIKIQKKRKRIQIDSKEV